MIGSLERLSGELKGKEKSSLKYIKLIKDVYDGVVTSVRINVGITNEFPIIISLH
jgi:hypothetical protein